MDWWEKEEAEIIRLYELGVYQSEIAYRLNTSHTKVWRTLKKYGFKGKE